jgi:hypothetical protein
MGYIIGVSRTYIYQLLAFTVKRRLNATGGTETVVLKSVGKLVSTITVKPPVDIVMNVGTAPLGNDIIDAANCPAGIATSITPNFYMDPPLKTLYFSGLVAGTEINIYNL